VGAVRVIAARRWRRHGHRVCDGRIVGARGRAADRVNHGRLGPKDLFGWQAGASPDRLTRPLVREGGRLVECDWERAMDRVVARSRSCWTSRAGIGTPHLDGNTRLCTSTAAEALKESFGCDGQPGSFSDVDHADVIALFGHNMAETQPVLWMRVLDRLDGAAPPRLVCVDPRPTPVAAAPRCTWRHGPGRTSPCSSDHLTPAEQAPAPYPAGPTKAFRTGALGYSGGRTASGVRRVRKGVIPWLSLPAGQPVTRSP
jgi:predicted molibdopterin-dependent oxidoreductase YjgC